MLLVLLRAVSSAQPPPITHKCPSDPCDHTQACGRHCEIKLMLESGDGYTGNSIMVLKGKKGQCPNKESLQSNRELPWDTLKCKPRLFPALWSRDFPQKTQALREAHLLLLCGEETEEELTAVGK